MVYGDIGTSPLYAMREALIHAEEGGITRDEVLGVTSLLLWALIFIVTCKYVLFLMRADNRGEGGTRRSWRWRSARWAARPRPFLCLGRRGPPNSRAKFIDHSSHLPVLSCLL